ncbi:MAG: hypothetical protein WBG57_07460, partial [Ornithinimicrobium sp.]
MSEVSSLWILVLAVLAVALVVTIVALTLRRRRDSGPLGSAQAALAGGPDAASGDTDAGALADGVAELLSATRSGGIVADRSGRVLRATSSALTFGLIRGRELSHPELSVLFDAVLADGRTREREFESARGPLGQGR